MTSNLAAFGDDAGTYSTDDTLVTTPTAHTMGARLSDYVLPKVPVSALIETGGRVHLYGNQSLGLLIGGAKQHGKLFNWRRPFFGAKHGIVHCVVAPGQDYAHHYARLVATACALVHIEPRVELEIPTPNDAVEFIDRWLPRDLARADVIILGYVEKLFAEGAGRWKSDPGFGWRQVSIGNCQVTLLGCEFSYWGDLAGALVTILAARYCASWVIYVGKLGALNPERVPNRYVATGVRSLVSSREVLWESGLNLNGPHGDQVLIAQRHITVPSTLDETRRWYVRHAPYSDVVDPEIGRMAEAARQATMRFDYLHVVSDNLSGNYVQGLYHEREFDVATNRLRCLTIIESILRRSFT